MSDILLVVCGALVDADGRVLICQRPEGKSLSGLWEFPGGKVEPGESDVEALVRECAEELDVDVTVGDRVGVDVPLAHGWAILRVYAAQIVNGGVPKLIEHADMRWLTADELDSVDWLPADAPIVAALPSFLDKAN